jgi:Zn-dependent peptidase ImmA (M78 family)
MIKFLLNPFDLVIQATNNLYPNTKCVIQFNPEMSMSEKEYGVTIFPEDNSIPIIEVNANLSVSNAVEILAHEISHVVAGKEADHNDKWEQIFDAINVEVENIANKIIEEEDFL